jgi:sRNA-binding protein
VGAARAGRARADREAGELERQIRELSDEELTAVAGSAEAGPARRSMARRIRAERRELRAAQEAAAKAQADREAAEAREREAREQAPLPMAVPEAERVGPIRGGGASVSSSQRWTYELEDMVKLAKAVGAGEVSPEVLELNRGEVAKLVRGGKRQMPGVRIFQRDVSSVRA